MNKKTGYNKADHQPRAKNHTLLNEYRVLKRMTVRDVSKKSGVSVGRVQAALSGDIGSLSLNNAMAICEVLEVNIYDAYKEVFANG